jgi:hypothetical protein
VLGYSTVGFVSVLYAFPFTEEELMLRLRRKNPMVQYALPIVGLILVF